jgi:hypothetical protein
VRTSVRQKFWNILYYLVLFGIINLEISSFSFNYGHFTFTLSEYEHLLTLLSFYKMEHLTILKELGECFLKINIVDDPKKLKELNSSLRL